MRFIWLCLVLCLGLNAHALKITQIVPFGTSSVRISFNKDFHPSAFKTIHLSPSKDLLEIKAQLLVPPKSYSFPHNTLIKLSKHGKHLIKILIKFHKHTPYQLKITNNHLYISLSNAPPTPSPPPPPTRTSPQAF
ncbi:N-acetylmuramoyl-L-alanine amidase [Helicobacter bizzozeronii CCUG 35545]|nr:N-acetylmuramoyl-L-alanine amidase [Helicobacter bizzozeronii CCUG 35545]